MATVTTDQNLTTVTYASAEDITTSLGATLTWDSAAATLPGSMLCITSGRLLLKNTSTTIPLVATLSSNVKDYRFEKNGIFETSGDWISLGTATGVSGETFSLASAPLNVIPYPSLVEIELVAGSGNFFPYLVIPTNGTIVTIPTTEFCAAQESGMVLFWDATARVLTAGNGTNGSLLTSGAAVRIPNLYVHSNSNNATPGNRTLIDISPTGRWISRITAYSNAIHVSNSTTGDVTLEHVGFAGTLVLGSSNANYILDHIAVGPDTEQTVTAQQVQVSGINGSVLLRKIRTFTGGLLNNGNKNIVQNLFGLTLFDDCFFSRRDGRTNAADEALSLQNITPGLRVNRLSWAGGRTEMTNLTNILFNDCGYADSVGTAQLTTVPVDAISGVNCSDLVFLGFRNAGISAPRGYLVGVDVQSSRIAFFNTDFNGQNNLAGAVAAGSGTGVKFVNGSVINIRDTGFFVDSPSTFLSSATEVRNLRSTLGSGSTLNNDPCQAGIYDLMPGAAASVSTAFAGGSNYNFANLIDVGLTPTAGNIVCGPFSTSTKFIISGTAQLDQAGGIELPNSGDIATAETNFPLHGITGLQNAAILYTYKDAITVTTLNDTTTPPTGVTIEFRVKNPSGAYGSYVNLDGANLAAAIPALSGYDIYKGLDLQLRFTATTTDSTRVINQVILRTDVDNTYIAPDATVNLLGPNPTDVTTLYRFSDNAVLGSWTGSGTKEISNAAGNFLQSVYFIRRTFDNYEIMRTRSMPQSLLVGNNGDVYLFAGAEVQLAQSSDVSAMKVKIDAYLDAAISSRLAAASYTLPDNVGISAIQAKTDQLTVNDGLIDADVKKMNNTEVIGTGVQANKWRGVGEPA